MRRPQSIAVFTHRHPEETGDALRQLAATVTAAGIDVLLPAAEAEKHALGPGSGVTVVQDAVASHPDVAVVLGGDGTMLGALRAFAERDVPVFAFNFGAIGFLATVDRGDLEAGVRRLIEGDFTVLHLPALAMVPDGERELALNDISFHRRHDGRVAELAYSVQGELLGQVRCDGLVASTPVGSTGYNLANGGPVLAWGVRGFAVSFIAPHTLTARTLVVATDDPLTVRNLSHEDPVDITADGRPASTLGPRQELEIRFEDNQALLAQLPGASFYAQLREKFGRLAY